MRTPVASLFAVVTFVLASGCADKRIDALAERHHRLEQRNQALSRQLREANSLLQRAQAESSSSLAAARERLGASQDNRARLQDELAKSALERNRTEGERRSLAERLSAARGEVRRLGEHARRLETLRAADRKRLIELEAAIADYRTRLQEYVDYVEGLPAESVETISVPAAISTAETIGDMLTPAADNILSRRQFAGIVQNMTENELVTYLGYPDRIVGSSPRYYVYDRSLTYALDRKTADGWVKIQIDDGLATFCFFP